MSDCNQMNCRNTCSSYQRMPAMRQGRCTDRSVQMRDSAYMQNTDCGCRMKNDPRAAGCDCRAKNDSRAAVYDRREKNDPRAAGCACRAKNDPLAGMALAIGYVPWQVWRNVYEPDKGFERATIFAELDKPFCGVRGGRHA